MLKKVWWYVKPFLYNTETRVARSPVFSGSSRISAPISRLPDRSQNLPYLTRRSLASEINVLETFCSLLIVHSTIWSDFCREAYHGQKLPWFVRGYPPKLGKFTPKCTFQWLELWPKNAREWADICMVAYHRQKLRRTTIGKEYLQMGEIWPKKWNFENVAKYLKDRPDIYREAYHRYKLPSIRGMKATTQNGGNSEIYPKNEIFIDSNCG